MSAVAAALLTVAALLYLPAVLEARAGPVETLLFALFALQAVLNGAQARYATEFARGGVLIRGLRSRRVRWSEVTDVERPGRWDVRLSIVVTTGEGVLLVYVPANDALLVRELRETSKDGGAG